MEIPKDTLDKIKEHARMEYPKEACGFILKDLSFLPCQNIAEQPEKDFLIDKNITLNYFDELFAVVHTHPTELILKQSGPSENDMRCQIASGLPWAILDIDPHTVADPYWLSDDVLETELYQQQFQHGVMDCYTAIRKWYFQKRGIKLLDFPRDDSWWETKNLYLENFQKAGFSEISLTELEDGDVILGSVNSDVINHGGVYLDNAIDGKGLLYHHLPNRLSRREPAGPWINRAKIGLRYAN